MSKLYQVFVSSTFEDLKDERQAILQLLLDNGYYGAGMETFPAMTEDIFTHIKRVIDESDYYLLIVAGRYGSINEEGTSYTELEYNYAVQQGKYVIVLMHGSLEDIPSRKTEICTDMREKLEYFREKLQEPSRHHYVKRWENISELKEKVITALTYAKEKYPKNGWVRIEDGNNPVANMTVETIIESLKKYLDNLQNEIRSISGKIYTSRSEYPKYFDIYSLLLSLGNLSIPFDISLLVLSGLKNVLIPIFRQNERISTNDIKRAIITRLHQLIDEDNEFKGLAWVGDYVRRYGPLDENKPRMECLLTNGGAQPLSYDFIEKTILPELIHQLYPKNEISNVLNRLSRLDKSKISQIIHDKVSGLMLYTIHQNTLQMISYDLAIQQPHPWMAKVNRKDEIMEYEYERAEYHYQIITSQDDILSKENRFNISIGRLFSSIEEMIYHCCACILTAYDLFIGTTESASIANLYTFLKNEHGKENEKIREIFSAPLTQYNHDASILKIDKYKFCRIVKQFSALNNVKHILFTISDDKSRKDYTNFLCGVDELYRITTEIFELRVRNKRHDAD